jgi:hypothetical protein
MADFDLTQTDAQVQSILNDGQNMQGAGAQTTLTTESVLLKDVNGNYHKILKSSFTEAIRDTLAGLLVNNDKGTTINQIAAIASGDFGSITPTNLASVLGVKEYFKTIKNGNSTRVYKIGTYANWTSKIIDMYCSGTSSIALAQLIVYVMKDGSGLANSRLFYKNISENALIDVVSIYCLNDTIYLKITEDIVINFRDAVEEVTGVDLTSAYEVTKQQLT